MKAFALSIIALSLVYVSGCSRGPGHAFRNWVNAIQAGDTEIIIRLDRDLAHRTADLPREALEAFAADLAEHLDRPAATAFLETGFGVEPSVYHRKLFFPEGARVEVKSEETRGQDVTQLMVEVRYQRNQAPVYVTDVQVVWHGPTGRTPGIDEPPDRPKPVFSSGYLEASHPFLDNPGYKGYELRLHSGAVQTATLRVDLAREPELGWTITDLTPVVAENIYWD